MKLRGVIFDLDGTVVENDYDWTRIRAELGTGETSILAYLDGLVGPERAAKWAVLESHEAAQTEASVLREGVRELLALLRARGLAAALVTNNSRRNTEFLLGKFGLSFDCVVTRESGLWKPSGAPFLEVLRTLGLAPDACGIVGDTRFDVLAALDAGIGAIFLLSDEPELFDGLPVEVFPDVDSLRDRLESLFPA
ncbi:MAG: HAD family hydrolase [Candidatus Aminicenantes bacterium]|nr:HAD family hydrolase [Candidatus Aminicenantes bacterium]NLH76665.1 HAD family hydrolase [Acidobacteriota bacterium]